ncbi:ATP-binding protein [Pseudonocardia sp.]|uniref:ATP-binding protein n=1 Tax=Pseudonocardia sp. TaxID=60912 RepID=UPI003D13E3BB
MDDHAIPDGSLHLSRPAHPAQLGYIRARVQGWAQQHRVPEGVLIDLQLALGEAVANGVEHAYTGMTAGTVDVEVRLWRTPQGSRRPDDGVAGPDPPPGGTITVRVADHGRWQPPTGSAHRGRGMLVIERLARNTEIIRGRNGTHVCFEIAF